MNGTVSLSVDGRIAIATIDNPPVNALSRAVRAGLVDAIGELEARSDLDALVIAGAGPAFIAGADVKEFGAPMQSPLMAEVAARIEGASKPIIAAIHGRALGGGLEVALACHARVANAKARIGMPEVNLGIIPGCGGTQRLPRLVGLKTALVMITEGREVAASDASVAGAIDAIVENDVVARAVAYAQGMVARGEPLRRVCDLPPPVDDPALFDERRADLAKRRRGHEAPIAALEAVRLTATVPFEEALVAEHGTSIALLRSPQSRALRHIFAAERLVAKAPGLPAGVTERPVRRVAVIGLGTMGAGIATVFANAGLEVVAIARSRAKLDAAMGSIEKSFAALVRRGAIDASEADRRRALITPATGHEALGDVDLVIESASEDIELKRSIFIEAGCAARPGAILATNTSYLDIDALAQASGRAADVCGMHFFNPATAMRLLEVVRGTHTSPEVIATVMALGRRIGKLPILAGQCEGFVVNRMLSKRSREGFFMLEEGASPDRIDRLLQGFGFPMGPYALADLAGIDVQYAARQARLGRLSPRERRADFVDQMYARGRHGQKTGAGWYRYDENRRASPDPETAELLAAHAERHGIAQRAIDDGEILERCLLAMVNEGARLIEEGVVPRPHEIDVAMVNGIGFPSYTGGPMWWADETGLAKVLDAICRYRDIAGADYWTPSPLLERLASTGGRFYDLAGAEA